MDHNDHINLIKGGIRQNPGVWADFGSGRGAFTLALAAILHEGSVIHSVDKDGGALRNQQRAMEAQFSKQTVHYHQADFSEKLDLPPLDGLIIANALHFYRPAHRENILKQIITMIKFGGTLIIVEYDLERALSYVPHPISYAQWEMTAQKLGLSDVQKIGLYRRSSGGTIYAAMGVVL